MTEARVQKLLDAVQLALPELAKAAQTLRNYACEGEALRLEHVRRILSRAADRFLDDTQPIDTKDVPE